MSIKMELLVIKLEQGFIAESEDMIRAYLQELNKFNVFSMGDELVGNDYSHRGKTFVVDKLYIGTGTYSTTDALTRLSDTPTMFIAEGYVKKKNGDLGGYRTTHSTPIGESK